MPGLGEPPRMAATEPLPKTRSPSSLDALLPLLFFLDILEARAVGAELGDAPLLPDLPPDACRGCHYL